VSRVGRHTLTLVTPPTDEPVTLSEVKSWSRIDTDDDDALVQQLIASARYQAEQYLRRSLLTQSWKLTHDLGRSLANDQIGEGTYDLPISILYGVLPRDIELPKGPIQTITSVTTYALDNTSSVYDPSLYFLDQAGERLVLNIGAIWPANMRPRAAAEFLYVTGYGDDPSDVPQPIKTGIMIHVASLYEQRGQSADSMDIPAGAKRLYAPFRVMGDRHA
jgi:hypothetical protein